MRLKMFVLFAVTIYLVGNAIGGEDKTVVTPSALIAQPVYEFKSVVDGTKVTYDYVIKNNGAATLEIQEVNTG